MGGSWSNPKKVPELCFCGRCFVISHPLRYSNGGYFRFVCEIRNKDNYEKNIKIQEFSRSSVNPEDQYYQNLIPNFRRKQPKL